LTTVDGATGFGISVDVDDGSWANSALKVNVTSGVAAQITLASGWAAYIDNNGNNNAIEVTNNGTSSSFFTNVFNAAGTGLRIQSTSGGTGLSVQTGGTGNGLYIQNTVATGRSILVESGAATQHLSLGGNGVLTLGTPTGPAVTGAGNLNAQGVYVNGVAVGTGGGGIAEPTATGNFLRSNTGSWVAGLPLSGGTTTGPITNSGLFSTTGSASGLAFDDRALGSSSGWIWYGQSGEARLYSYAAGWWVLAFGANGVMTVGTPSGPAVTGAGNINCTGIYVNGVGLGTGITDGSDAVAGQVGEVLQDSGLTSVTLGGWSGTAVGQLTLSPGDWELSGYVYGNSNAVPNGAFFVVAVRSAAVADWWDYAAMRNSMTVSNGILALGLPSERRNVTAAMTLYLVLMYNTAAAAMDFGHVFTARRMR